ncbi:6-phospho-3-hexuloisomerase [Lactobacillus panisapium]|uniref:6-phospho-3-hexuloisomerase n=1 Tax=Lactobacillus panisapium TaxID=2012495 RepID=UPI001C69C119|nr:6-phospho-3-hexuloisomerase [Lactobacillus panisapium]QYN54121.1 6-phospho-3-hexuloisomerase [Lactobacillus panisapium]
MKAESTSIINQVLKEINYVLHKVDERQIDQVVNTIKKDKRIFVLGFGRSGFMAKSFAMRLMHIGYQVYVIGETITPSIQKEDILISVSGSGNTKSVLDLTQKAYEMGVNIIVVTSNRNSQLAKLASNLLIIPGATKNGDGVRSIQLLSSLFDQTTHIVLDILCLKLSLRNHISNEEAKKEHSNLE